MAYELAEGNCAFHFTYSWSIPDRSWIVGFVKTIVMLTQMALPMALNGTANSRLFG